MRAERQKREKQGRRAEDIAAVYLRLKGYQILEKRYRTPLGEIDLIAEKSGVIALIEVKYRKSLEDAQWAITPRQVERILQAGELYIARNSAYMNHDRRLDAVYVGASRLPVHQKQIVDF